MRTIVVLAALLVLLSTASPAMTDPAGAAAADSAQARATLTVRSSPYARILFDGRGYALYAFSKDTRGRSACSGACARAWPPYLASGTLRAGKGIDASLLSTIRRADGTRQVTYAGRPLYYYVGDTKRGEVSCQNVFEYGGLWLVVRASGRVVR